MSLRDALTTFLVTGHITQIAQYFRTHRDWFMTGGKVYKIINLKKG